MRLVDKIIALALAAAGITLDGTDPAGGDGGDGGASGGASDGDTGGTAVSAVSDGER